MSYERTAQPIRLGYLFDFRLPDDYPEAKRQDMLGSLALVFREGLERGQIDRPVEIVYREVEGLPKGNCKAVVDAFAELVDEGCLAVFGPSITDNAVPLRREIEERFRVPALSLCGSEDWLGEWTFALPQGSMSDEPVFWAQLIAKRGLTRAGLLIEQSLIGEHYARNFRKAAAAQGIAIVAEEWIAQTAQDVSGALAAIRAAGGEALVHCGFGFGMVGVNPALAAMDWDPPRYLGTAFQNAWINPAIWQAVLGWTGLDQYDEGNPVGQAFLDRFEREYGRRPEYCVPVCKHDTASLLLHAFADARPLTPRGVRDALERIKMLPAAAGSPGTCLSLGNWMHRAWVGKGYLVARTLEPDGANSRLVARFD